MKIGIAISTYLSNINRLGTICKMVDSLYTTNFLEDYQFYIVFVDDGSPLDDHLKYLNNKFEFFKKTENGGIAKCKNTCLKILNENKCDIFILLDDDIVFTNPLWYLPYCTILQYGLIRHLTASSNPPHKKDQICKVPFKNTGIRPMPSYLISRRHTQGYALFYHKSVLESCGYFKIPPTKWGHEHIWYSRRITNVYKPEYNKFLKLNLVLDYIYLDIPYRTIELIDSPSTVTDADKALMNTANRVLYDKYEWCPCIE